MLIVVLRYYRICVKSCVPFVYFGIKFSSGAICAVLRILKYSHTAEWPITPISVCVFKRDCTVLLSRNTYCFILLVWHKCEFSMYIQYICVYYVPCVPTWADKSVHVHIACEKIAYLACWSKSSLIGKPEVFLIPFLLSFPPFFSLPWLHISPSE